MMKILFWDDFILGEVHQDGKDIVDLVLEVEEKYLEREINSVKPDTLLLNLEQTRLNVKFVRK